MNRTFCDRCEMEIPAPKMYADRSFTNRVHEKFIVRTKVAVDALGPEGKSTTTIPDLCLQCFYMLMSIALREVRESLQDEKGN